MTEDSTSNRSKRLRNALILAPVALFPFVLFGVLFLFRSSSLKRAAADQGIYVAEGSPQVAAQIGLPIEPGWPIRGSVISRRGEGNADLQLPLHGSHGDGTLALWAQQEKGKWYLCELSFHPSNGPGIELSVPAHPKCEPE